MYQKKTSKLASKVSAVLFFCPLKKQKLVFRRGEKEICFPPKQQICSFNPLNSETKEVSLEQKRKKKFFWKFSLQFVPSAVLFFFFVLQKNKDFLLGNKNKKTNTEKKILFFFFSKAEDFFNYLQKQKKSSVRAKTKKKKSFFESFRIKKTVVLFFFILRKYGKQK